MHGRDRRTRVDQNSREIPTEKTAGACRVVTVTGVWGRRVLVVGRARVRRVFGAGA